MYNKCFLLRFYRKSEHFSFVFLFILFLFRDEENLLLMVEGAKKREMMTGY